MYINKCTKCGAEFETKNPKRVICPNCLYPERKATEESEVAVSSSMSADISQSERSEYLNGYSSGASFGGDDRDYQQRSYNRYERNNSYNRQERPQRSYDDNRGGYNDRPQRSYGDRPQRNYNNDNRYQRGYNQGRSNYDRPQRNYDGNRGGYSDRPQRSYGDRPQRNFGDRPQRSFNRNQGSYGAKRGGFNKRPQPKAKQLLITKEQLEQIEFIYKKALPLPNHDIHEVIGTALGIEPRKVFFGINLVRQKMMLPKLPFPKRKLAVTPDQLTAIKMLYEPLLPLPPIGCHKLIATQLKMDEWRVHVGIGLVRKEMGLDRWNPDRPDAPEEYKK